MLAEQLIIPALIPASIQSLHKDLKTLDFVQELQIDVVDGEFVSPISWPYEPKGSPGDIKSVLSKYSCEVDMMVADQVASAELWIKAGAEKIIFHVEGVDLSDVKKISHQYTEVNIGIAINNETPLEALSPYLAFVDMVQLMGISTIGAQGTPFDDRVVDRIKHLRTNYTNLLISIDGSMNQDTLPLVKSAGADRFVVGSALLRSDDRQKQYDYLTSLVK